MFKPGDLVYAPNYGHKVFSLRQYVPDSKYSLSIMIDGRTICFTKSGIAYGQKYQSLFHATPKNQTLLEELYELHFENPNSRYSTKLEKNPLY